MVVAKRHLRTPPLFFLSAREAVAGSGDADGGGGGSAGGGGDCYECDTKNMEMRVERRRGSKRGVACSDGGADVKRLKVEKRRRCSIEKKRQMKLWASKSRL